MAPIDKASETHLPAQAPVRQSPQVQGARRTSNALEDQRPYRETLDELDERINRLEVQDGRRPGTQPMPIAGRQRPRSPTILDLNDPFAGDHVMQPLSPRAKVPYSWQQSPRLYGVDSAIGPSAEERDRHLIQQIYGISPRQETRLELPPATVRPSLAMRSQSSGLPHQARSVGSTPLGTPSRTPSRAAPRLLDERTEMRPSPSQGCAKSPQTEPHKQK